MKRLYFMSSIREGVVCAALCIVGGGPALGQQTEYRYDDLGRLKTVEYDNVDVTRYKYDAAGNRLRVSTNDDEGIISIDAVDDAVSVDVDSSVTIFPIENDRDGVGALSISTVSAPENGTAIISGGGVSVGYTPNSGFSGEDSFTYVVSDEANTAAQATVTVNVLATPRFSILSDVSATEGDVFTFSIVREGRLDTAVSIDVDIQSAGATTDDYADASGEVVFAPHVTSIPFSVVSLHDDDFEGDENFYVDISTAAAGVEIGTGRREGLILDDDGVYFSIENAPSVVEGEDLIFTVTKSGSSTHSHSVNYATGHDGAGAGDYDSASGILTFSPSDPLTQTITVSTNDDDIFEGNESLHVALSSPSNGATIIPGQESASGLITDNDTQSAPSFSVNNATAVEGDNLVFTVTKTGETSSSHAVSYATSNSGSAEAGSDYTASSGTLTFAHDDDSLEISVPLADDGIYENTEAFEVDLSSPTNGATISASNATGTITNVNSAPRISVNNASAPEGEKVRFTISLANPSSFPHTVNYSTTNGSANPATAGGDYTSRTSSVTFSAGQTSPRYVEITTSEDEQYEQDETFNLKLTSVSGPGAVLVDDTGVGTITNDDTQNNDPAASTVTRSQVIGSSKAYYPLSFASDTDGDPLTVVSHTKTSGLATIWYPSNNRLQVEALGLGGQYVIFTVSDGRGGTATGRININVSSGGSGGGSGSSDPPPDLQ